MKAILFLLLACLSIPAHPANSGSSDRCHCFRQRDYNPSQKFAADDYLLTTSFNSLIAATLGTSKQQIILMKMKGGVDPDNLLIALYMADRTRTSRDILLSIHDNGGSWKKIMESMTRQNKNADDPVLAEISAGASDRKITALITDALIRQRYRVRPEQLNYLRKEQFNNREINLICALQQQTGQPAANIAAMARRQKMSWSEIADSFGCTPANVGKKIIAPSQELHPAPEKPGENPY
jgi:hypothetical protein